ncbi:MAG TPA: hypothetical protein VFR34_15895 [Paracoccaceae bacterium]|nr:hypothetical protein [Paracoccaceae bacterium]
MVLTGQDEMAEQRRLLASPLGEPGSGMARYAAAMFFYRAGRISADELEVFRVCARMDGEDPREWARGRGLDWERVEALLRG